MKNEVLNPTTRPKLSITQNLLYKIYRLCQVNNPVEWSAVLIYKILEGSVEDPGNFKLEAIDLFLMDIGTSGYTEYEFDESVAGFLCDNPKYMEVGYALGHIHSHNNMETFFSGTDKQELKDNAPNHEFYLSLIVNNKNNMCAKIAIAEEVETIVTTNRKTRGFKNWFKGTPKKTMSSSVVDYDCDIRLLSDTTFEKRLIEIKDISEARPKHIIRTSSAITNDPFITNRIDLHGKHKQTAMFDMGYINDSLDTEDDLFTKDQVLNYANYILGDLGKSTFENLTKLAFMQDKDYLAALENIKNTHVETFTTMFSEDSVAVLPDLLEEVREELLDFEDSPDEKVSATCLHLVSYFDNHLIPLYDNPTS
jgi:proteasome lid subunit RPN8/RPN11